MSQRAYLHLKQVGGFGLIARRLTKGLDDVGLLKIVEVRCEVQSLIREIEFGIDPLRIVIRNMVRKPLKLDLVAAFEGHGTLNCVFELANVAAPHIVLQGAHRLRRDRKVASSLITEFTYEVIREIWNILSAFSKRRQVYRNNRDPIEEVFAKRAVRGHLF